jgi:hypothetical protein
LKSRISRHVCAILKAPQGVVTSGYEGALFVQCGRDDHIHHICPKIKAPEDAEKSGCEGALHVQRGRDDHINYRYAVFGLLCVVYGALFLWFSVSNIVATFWWSFLHLTTVGCGFGIQGLRVRV